MLVRSAWICCLPKSRRPPDKVCSWRRCQFRAGFCGDLLWRRYRPLPVGIAATMIGSTIQRGSRLAQTTSPWHSQLSQSLFCPEVTRTTPQSTKSEKFFWGRTFRPPFFVKLTWPLIRAFLRPWLTSAKQCPTTSHPWRMARLHELTSSSESQFYSSSQGTLYLYPGQQARVKVAHTMKVRLVKFYNSCSQETKWWRTRHVDALQRKCSVTAEEKSSVN